MEFIGILLALSIVIVNGQNFTVEVQKHYEFENALKEGQGVWQHRSEASLAKTLRINDLVGGTKMIHLTLCIQPYDTSQNVTFYIDDIRYSNDGPSDNITVLFNGLKIATFKTVEKWRAGQEWNVFRNSGRIGPSLEAMEGQYVLTVYAKTDEWGVELDRIRINAENHSPAKELFCDATYTEPLK
ncbi:uncharacterized protein LOC128204564 [Mya arenaria]|uniref:uncharacterized protein LOC128204564 n=1 Tax=Mya arenaria TaxID=6604 RepID=UPI0022E4752D|nr:uncharacterized protein LOC128204564 [Mya arenaria]